MALSIPIYLINVTDEGETREQGDEEQDGEAEEPEPGTAEAAEVEAKQTDQGEVSV